MLRGMARELAAEFLGTFVLVVFGCAVVAQVTLSQQENGQYLSINLGWGLAVTMGCYVAGGVTGAHLNPAVTLALAAHRGFAYRKVLPYILAQLAGAFIASAVVYGTYHEALNYFDGGTRFIAGEHGTAGIWATYPNAKGFLTTVPGGLVDQIVGTALLVGCIFAIGDERNIGVPKWLGPIAVGALVLLIGMTFGLNAGYAINPARDFAPRLFTALAGWGWGVFSENDYWWWVPVVGPLIGGVLGGLVYDLCITWNLPPREE